MANIDFCSVYFYFFFFFPFIFLMGNRLFIPPDRMGIKHFYFCLYSPVSVMTNRKVTKVHKRRAQMLLRCIMQDTGLKVMEALIWLFADIQLVEQLAPKEPIRGISSHMLMFHQCYFVVSVSTLPSLGDKLINCHKFLFVHLVSVFLVRCILKFLCSVTLQNQSISSRHT